MVTGNSLRHPAITAFVAIAALTALRAVPAAAESAISGSIAFQAGALAGKNGVSAAPELGSGRVTIALDAEKNDAVKASAALTATDTGTAYLERAWMKARFPLPHNTGSARLTAGLAPISWGKGFLFNAGDTIFGEIPTMSGLSGGEYRTATAWLASAYLPFGSFSYAEALWLPPAPAASGSLGTVTAKPRPTRAGGRLVLAPSWAYLQSVEAGWLHDETGDERGSLAADGSLWADWYVSSSFVSRNPAVSASGKGPAGADWSVSLGLFRIIDIPDYPLTLRLEGLSHPALRAEAWFALASLGAGEFLSLGAQALYASGAETIPGYALAPGSGMAGVVLNFAPLKGFSMTASALRPFDTERNQNVTGKSDVWILTVGTEARY